MTLVVLDQTSRRRLVNRVLLVQVKLLTFNESFNSPGRSIPPTGEFENCEVFSKLTFSDN